MSKAKVDNRSRVEKTLDSKISKYKMVCEDIKKYENYRNVLGQEIIDTFEMLGISSQGGIRVVHEKTLNYTKLDNLLNLEINDIDEVLKQFIVKVDIAKTKESLVFLENYNEFMINKLISMITELIGENEKSVIRHIWDI